MPWDLIKLNDGRMIPSIAFGTWKLGNGEAPISQVDQAIEVGFSHVDTAQAYANEQEAGQAIRESGLAREEIFITTKFSGRDGLSISQSIENSLKNLGVSYVDLYLIHHPRLARPNIPAAWREMEKVRGKGLARSIGVSNFGVDELAKLVAGATVLPAANQILLHPYVYKRQLPTIEFGRKYGIVTEAYSPLTPVTTQPGGELDKPLGKIAKHLGVTPDQVLLAWTKSKGVVVVTTSSKKERLEGYLKAGDLELSPADIGALEKAGEVGYILFALDNLYYPFASANSAFPAYDEGKQMLIALVLILSLTFGAVMYVVYFGSMGSSSV